jgi:glycosyltransferase involved in cell wall biosynthesis
MIDSPAIFHITSGHRSFDDRIFFKEARSLAARYPVFLLSAGRDGELTDMGGNLRPPGNYEGVELRAYAPARVGGLAGKARRKLRSVLGLPSIPGLFGRLTAAIDACGPTPAILHLHDSELLALAPRLKARYGCKILFDCHEYYYWYFGEEDFRSGRYFRKALRLHRRYRRLFAPCDAIVSVTETMRAMNWCIAPDAAHETICNSTLLAEMKEARRGPRVRLVHEGTLSFNRGFALMLELFKDRWFKENAVLKIVGTIGEAERARLELLMAEDPSLAENLEITGWVPYEELGTRLDGDIGLIFMDPIPNNYMGLPNKFFNYIGAGMPIVSVPQLEVGARLRAFGLGVVAERSVEGVKAAVLEIVGRLEWYRENVRANRERFSWAAEAPKLYGLYERLLGPTGA